MNGIRSFQATDPDTVPKFHCIVVNRLFRDWELDEIRSRITRHHAAFLVDGTPGAMRYESDEAQCLLQSWPTWYIYPLCRPPSRLFLQLNCLLLFFVFPLCCRFSYSTAGLFTVCF